MRRNLKNVTLLGTFTFFFIFYIIAGSLRTRSDDIFYKKGKFLTARALTAESKAKTSTERPYLAPEIILRNRKLLQTDFIGGQIGALNKNLEYIIAIPTVYREKESYLQDTLDSVLASLEAGSQSYGIIVFFGGGNISFFTETSNQLMQNYAKAIDDGILTGIVASPDFYPDYLSNGTGEYETLIPTFGDSIDRMIWRTRQSLDYLFLWSLGLDSANYFLQIEDDVLANYNFLTFIDKKVTERNRMSKNWISMEFCSLGFIGKLFQNQSLENLVMYAILFFKDKPIDWIYWSFIHMKACSPEWDKKKCQTERRKFAIAVQPAQFSHIGQFSSLTGKVQRLQDKTSFRNPLLLKIETNMGESIEAIASFWTEKKEFNLPRFKDSENKTEARWIEFSLKHAQAYGMLEIISGTASLKGKLPEETLIEVKHLSETGPWRKIAMISNCQKPKVLPKASNAQKLPNHIGLVSKCNLAERAKILNFRETSYHAIRLTIPSSIQEEIVMKKLSIY